MASNMLGSEHRFLNLVSKFEHLCFHYMDSRMITAIGCYTSLGTGSPAKLPCKMYEIFIACTDYGPMHQALVFVCEVAWLLHHTFSNHAIPLVISLWLCGASPPIPCFYGLAKGYVGLWSCGMCVYYVCLCMYNCRGVPSSLRIRCPELTLCFEWWSPHPQTMDTELLSQRLAEYHYCLPEHMYGHAASALWICCQHSDQTTILQRTEIPCRWITLIV